jgi:hypothetical protein
MTGEGGIFRASDLGSERDLEGAIPTPSPVDPPLGSTENPLNLNIVEQKGCQESSTSGGQSGGKEPSVSDGTPLQATGNPGTVALRKNFCPEREVWGGLGLN